MVTAIEAKKILLDQRAKNRERQKEYQEKMRAEGYRRVALMISGEAHRFLEEEARRLEMPKGKILSDIIENALKPVNGNIGPIINQSFSNEKPAPDTSSDREAIMARIMSLSAEGFSHQQIADQLEAEGVPTAKGGKWQRRTVGKMISRAKSI